LKIKTYEITSQAKYLEPFPLPKIESLELQSPSIESVDLIVTLKNEFQVINKKFVNYFTGQYKLDKLPKKLEN